jgi:epoxyqueuosine reductase
MTSDDLKNFALSLGFDEVRITGPTPTTWDRFFEWLSRNCHGEMSYLANRAEERRCASNLLESTRSVILVAKNYLTVEPRYPSPESPFTPMISRYAWGDDYHAILAEGLQKIVEYIHVQSEGKHQARWCVDTAPLLEKDFASQSGIGWVGKNTNVLNRRLGNWFFLGAVLTTLELDVDAPVSPHCGACARCLEICPTKAFLAPYVLDARRCISYLTIELKSPIPREFRRAMGLRIYGCDECLAVCPWNRFAVPSQETGFLLRASLQALDLIQLMKLSEEGFRSLFKNSPIKRTKRRGFLRNVAVALGNACDRRAVPALIDALSDSEPLIRGHAAWALGEIGGDAALYALKNALEWEEDVWVNEELHWAIHPAADDGKA